MAEAELESAVPDGESLRHVGRLRRGGTVGLTEERLLVVGEATDGQATSVQFDDVDEVEFQDFDYFVGVLSLVLFGFGIYAATKNVLAGAGLSAAGVLSLYVSYRKRDRAMVRTHSRPKPLTMYPEDASEFYDALGDALGDFRERTDRSPD